MSQFGDDCYFYYYSSCTKGTSCTFRHCEEALGNETICTNWRKGKCYRSGCMFRHMTIQVDRSRIACFWESQPSGCTKPHCVFKHYLLRNELGTVSPPFVGAVKDPASSTPSIPDEVVPQKIEPVVVNPLEESDQESICSPQIKKTSPQEKPVEERSKVNALRRLGPRRIEDNFEKGSQLGIKPLDKMKEDSEFTPRATQERLKQIISQKKGHVDPVTNLDENIPVSQDNIIMQARIQAERIRMQPNEDIVPSAVKRRIPENKCDKPLRKVVKYDNVKKVVPLAATTKQVTAAAAATTKSLIAAAAAAAANTCVPPPLPLKRKTVQYSSEDENDDNSSTGSSCSEDSELNFKVKSLHEIRAEKKKRFTGKESSMGSVTGNESVTKPRIESVTKPRIESVTRPKPSACEQKMKKGRQIYVPPAVRSQVDSHDISNGLNSESITQAARKASLVKTTLKPLLTKSDPPIIDLPTQYKTETGSLEKIKIKSFAEIMAEKRQRAQQKSTECPASGPITITDSSERTSPIEAPNSNAAKKAPTLALWTRKKLAVVENEQKNEMEKPGTRTQQAASKKPLDVAFPPASQNSNNSAISEASQPKIQCEIPPSDTKALSVAKVSNITPTRASKRRASALAAAPPAAPPASVASKSAPEKAQTPPKAPANPVPKGRGRRGVASVTSPIPKPDPKSIPNPKTILETSPVLKTVATRRSARAEIDSKPPVKEVKTTLKTPAAQPEEKVEAPAPPTERTLSNVSDGIFDDDEFDAGDMTHVGADADNDDDDVLRQLEEMLAN